MDWGWPGQSVTKTYGEWGSGGFEIRNVQFISFLVGCITNLVSNNVEPNKVRRTEFCNGGIDN